MVDNSRPSNPTRYLRLYAAFLRCTIMQHMSFRGNFLIQVAVEFLWFALLLLFYDIVFGHTTSIAGWTHEQYLILLGTFFIVTGLVEAFVMPNCAQLTELVRTGNLDFALTKPVDEQFILTVPKVDWAPFSNVAYGAASVLYGIWNLPASPPLWTISVYVALIVAAFLFFYSVMVTLAVTAVYVVRNQSIYEQWFYVNLFARYPPEIFSGSWGHLLRKALTYVFPVLVVVSVPARLLAQRILDTRGLMIAAVAAAVSLVLSRAVFRRVLRAYRGASA